MNVFQFSTHSFVLDSEIYGKAAFQRKHPGRTFCPTHLYAHLIESKQIDEDPMQLNLLKEVEILYDALIHGGRPSKRSLYIHGPAGSGKSMVMDLFHFCLQQSGVRTRRQHFHEFLYDMQRQLHQLHLKQRDVSTHEFIRQISVDMARNLDVLCFDEFAITTIQDCTLLVPLFSQIFMTNICLVTTSNRHPDNLYEDGLNRHLYLPKFLDILHSNSVIANVKSEDYREREFIREHSNEHVAKVFFGSDLHAVQEANTLMNNLGLDFSSQQQITIGYGRNMLVEKCNIEGTVASFDARKLFGGPPYFGADDYNAICKHFHTIVLDGLWVLDVADHNEAKRLTNFLDCAYESHSRIVCVNMELDTVELLFMNLLPLETLSLKEIASMDKDTGTPKDGNGSIAETIKNLPVASSQQSCFFLSPDHKDWSVESKIVHTSSRNRSVGVSRAERMGQQPEEDSSALFDDSSSEQHSVKGVFVAAVASLHETGFAVKRAISRLKEMQTTKYLDAHRTKHLSRSVQMQTPLLASDTMAVPSPGGSTPSHQYAQ